MASPLDVYLAATGRLRANLLRVVLEAFRRPGSWDRADAEAFTSFVVPVVRGAQQQMAALTDRYIADTVGADPVGVRLPEDLRGVDAAVVYERPYIQLWSELKNGKEFEQALEAAERRLESLAATDLQLAKTHASASAVGGHGERIVGYRRVPEGAYSCALCLIASTQRYRRGDLMPIHPACDCSVAPILGGADPGHVIDPGLLERVHDAVAAAGYQVDRGGRVADYRQLIITHEHGELGPTLGWRGQTFTGPGDIAP